MFCSSRCVAKLCRKVWGDTRLSISAVWAAAWQARLSWRVVIGWHDRARKQPALRTPGLPPVAQQLEQVRGQHHVAIFAAFALLDADASCACCRCRRYLERDHLGGAQSRAVGDAQRRLVFEPRCGIQQARHLLGA